MPRYPFNISTCFWEKLPDRLWLMLKVSGKRFWTVVSLIFPDNFKQNIQNGSVRIEHAFIYLQWT